LALIKSYHSKLVEK